MKKKSDETREKIIQAACIIFSRHAYNAASMRMIGTESGYEHPLINYYFPSKAALFETVLARLCDEFFAAHTGWLAEAKQLGTAGGLARYIDLLLDYDRDNPATLRIMTLNLVQADRHEEIPGYRHIPELITRCRQTLMNTMRFSGDPAEVAIVTNSFNALLIMLLGGRSCYARVHGLDQGDPSYRLKVREMLLYVFEPLIRKLV